MRPTFRRLAAAAAIAALPALGLAAPASAAVRPAAPEVVIGSTVYTDYLAGYATSSNGDTHFDDVRAAVARALHAALGGAGRAKPVAWTGSPPTLEAHGLLDAATRAQVVAGAMEVVATCARALLDRGEGR